MYQYCEHQANHEYRLVKSYNIRCSCYRYCCLHLWLVLLKRDIILKCIVKIHRKQLYLYTLGSRLDYRNTPQWEVHLANNSLFSSKLRLSKQINFCNYHQVRRQACIVIQSRPLKGLFITVKIAREAINSWLRHFMSTSDN